MVRLVRLRLGLQQMLLTRIGLFVSFGLIMATCVVANAAIAYRLRPRLGAQVPTSPLLERYREMLESRFVWSWSP